MSNQIHVAYGSKCVRPTARTYVVLTKPRIPYVGAILDFITHPLVWYPMWMAAAVLAWRYLA